MEIIDENIEGILRREKTRENNYRYATSDYIAPEQSTKKFLACIVPIKYQIPVWLYSHFISKGISYTVSQRNT